MGQPAARQGDMTAHGGTIAVGFPTVCIGGMPAARLGDMHTCPMATPGTPPVPHVGGPIVKGSTGVFIGGMPAARVGDMATCVGPPDSIAVGCPTVFIGEIGGGGGGGGGAASDAGAASAAGGASGGSGRAPHWIDLRFTDRGGRPIVGVPFELRDPAGGAATGELGADGGIRRDGLPAGDCTVQLYAITNACWSAASAEVGDELTLSADVAGLPDGTPATVTIYDRDLRGDDREVAVLAAEVSGERIEVRWTFAYCAEDEEPAGVQTRRGYSSPQHAFVVRAENAVARSGFLRLRDWLEIELHDDEGEPMAGEPYVVHLPDGSLREGELDDQGCARLEGLPVRACRVTFPGLRPGEGAGET